MQRGWAKGCRPSKAALGEAGLLRSPWDPGLGFGTFPCEPGRTWRDKSGRAGPRPARAEPGGSESGECKARNDVAAVAESYVRRGSRPLRVRRVKGPVLLIDG
jgi:hypothetical protein